MLGLCKDFSFVEVTHEYVMVACMREIYRANTITSPILFVGGKLYIMELPGALLSPNLKNTKTLPEKISYIFSKKLFLYFGKRNFLIFSKKVFLVPRETEFFYISGNNFPSSKIKKKPSLKKFFIFWEMELSSHMVIKL